MIANGKTSSAAIPSVPRIFWTGIVSNLLDRGLAEQAGRLEGEHQEKQHEPGKFDIPGFILSATSLPLVLYALAEAPGSGWTSARVVITGLGGIALMALLVVVETRVAEPMLALRLFRDRMFRNAGFGKSELHGMGDAPHAIIVTER